MSKNLQNRGLDAPKSKPRELQGGFGAVLGSLGPSGAFLEAFWKRLGSVLERFGKPLGPSWAEKGGQHGSNFAPKTEPKSIKKPIPKLINFFSASWNRLLEGLWRILDADMKQS